MKISAYNGSPRGRKSNSNVLLDFIIEGTGMNIEKKLVSDITKKPTLLEDLQSVDVIILVFPLYADSMPGIVMRFFEELGNMREAISGKSILYVVHSGFPEGKQSFPLRNYLESLSQRLNLKHIDVIIMGGSESLRMRPINSLRKEKRAFNSIGRSIVTENPINDKIKEQLMKPISLSTNMKLFINILKPLGLLDFYWNSQLKKNGAYEKRYDKPYVSP